VSRDEILTLKPGTKLNLLIATKVLSWTIWEEKRGDYLYVIFQKPNDREPWRAFRNPEIMKERYRQIEASEIDEMKHIVHGLKDWSRSIEDAMKLFDRFYPTNLQHYSGIGDETVYKATIEYDWVVADTASGAICKAVLLYMERGDS